MKVTFSLTEAIEVLREKFQLPNSATIAIGDNAGLARAAHDKFLSDLGGSIQAANKIAAIKSLRVTVPDLGLANAKWAIEHWDAVSSYVKVHGEWPPFGSNGWNYTY